MEGFEKIGNCEDAGRIVTKIRRIYVTAYEQGHVNVKCISFISLTYSIPRLQLFVNFNNLCI